MSGYWEPMEEATAKAGEPTVLSAMAPLKFSFLGRIEIRAVGPKGSMPVPKVMVPPDRRLDPQLIENLDSGLLRLQSYCTSWKGIDIVRTKFKNPFVPLIKMTLADALEVHIQHCDRHLGQMEKVSDHLRRVETAKGVS
jgi:hypothetical protein